MKRLYSWYSITGPTAKAIKAFEDAIDPIAREHGVALAGDFTEDFDEEED
jgi:hypothetical protein